MATKVEKTHTTVFIPITLHKRFKAYAARKGQSFSAAIQEAMIKLMKE